MIFENNEKVLAMYRAVCSLVEEGCDIHRLKVADITAKAGIGKGTAYEYFRSKDELLIRALQYDYYLSCHKIEEALKEGRTFRDNVEVMFGQIEQCCANRRLSLQFMKLLDEFREKNENCVKEHMTKEIRVFTGLLDQIAELGKKEGCINSGVPGRFVRLELGSKLIGYYIFLQTDKTEEERREMKDFLYGTIMKSLS